MMGREPKKVRVQTLRKEGLKKISAGVPIRWSISQGPKKKGSSRAGSIFVSKEMKPGEPQMKCGHFPKERKEVRASGPKSLPKDVMEFVALDIEKSDPSGAPSV